MTSETTGGPGNNMRNATISGEFSAGQPAGVRG